MEQGLAFKLRGALKTQFSLDVLAMRTDSLRGEAKLGGDGARGPAAANQQENLHFAIGELGIALVGRAAKPPGEKAAFMRAETAISPRSTVSRASTTP